MSRSQYIVQSSYGSKYSKYEICHNSHTTYNIYFFINNNIVLHVNAVIVQSTNCHVPKTSLSSLRWYDQLMVLVQLENYHVPKHIDQLAISEMYILIAIFFIYIFLYLYIYYFLFHIQLFNYLCELLCILFCSLVSYLILSLF